MSRKIAWVAVIALMFVNAVSLSAATGGGATGAVISRALIDFNTFEANMGVVVSNDNTIHQKMIAENPDLDLSKYGYYPVVFKPADWHLSNWVVELCSSANTVQNNIYSYCRKVTSQSNFNGPTSVLGVRVHFPQWTYLSWAKVRPPFDFFVNFDNGQYVNEKTAGDKNSLEMGVLVNVGKIKDISVWIYGLNYPHQIALRLKDRDNKVQEYFITSTYYEGWRRPSWINPDYSADIRDRDLERIPLYPLSYPYVKFDSFVIYKPETSNGGDYITYIKDVWMDYERALVKESLDIDDESVWNILSQQQSERRAVELRQISETLYLRDQETRRRQNAGN